MRNADPHEFVILVYHIQLLVEGVVLHGHDPDKAGGGGEEGGH